MTVAFLDRIDQLSLVEKHGVIRSLTRKARVLFDVRPNNFTILSEALAFVPAPFSTLTEEGYSSLVLIGREPSLGPDPQVVDVILKYEHILDGPNQELFTNNRRGILFSKGRCSITEKPTNFYWPLGAVRNFENRTQIQVAHYFPDTVTSVIGDFVQPILFPRTIFQGGEINVPFPQGNIQLQGISDPATNPWDVANQFIAAINDNTWLTKPARTWICSEVQWDILDVRDQVYRFGFEFQNNPDEWDPTAVFLDQRTGRPPANVARGDQIDDNGTLSLVRHPTTLGLMPAGMWQVPYLRRVNFDELFNAFFDGGV